MSRLQIVVLVVTVLGIQLVVLFPPWLEMHQTEEGLHGHPHCCFDQPIWQPPDAAHNVSDVVIDRWRLLRQAALVVALGGFAFFVAGRRK